MDVSTKITADIQLNSELPETGYTIKWVLEMLFANNSKFMAALGSNKIKGITARDISDGDGALSKVFLTVVEFTDASSYAIVMKVPTMDHMEETFEKLGMDEKVAASYTDAFKTTHNRECDAYTLIKDVKNFPMPEIYHMEYRSDQHPGVIVMEYFDEATTTGAFRSVTIPQILNVARHLGTFQAAMSGKNGWRGKYLESLHTSETNLTQMPTFMKQAGELLEELKQPVQRLLTIDFAALAIYALRDLPAEYDAMTFCNGDTWANNIMFKTSNDGSVTNQVAAFIDWQICVESSPLTDLGRFVTVSADAEIRRECEQKAVDVFYDTFCTESTKLGQKVGYTKEQAHELYDYMFMVQTCAMVGMASYIKMVNIKKASPKVHEAQCEKLLLRARLCLEDAFRIMEKYKVFERFPAKESN